ncbi:hypothetical protein [Desulfonatronospira sp.]|uniref:hypothetical protein n=1 Tax=Desulfonatronospira sp. TaxID=1962951 RepID=UPI0025BB0292|nr:hypothetical protein [Desulfonatronospira sp.]
MVNLGLAWNPESCPLYFSRLFFVSSADQEKLPVLNSWPQEEHRIWELIFPIKENQDQADWVLELSRCLKGLSQSRWCISTPDLVQVFNLPLDKALARWGELFWPNYRLDSVFIFTTGDDPALVRDILKMWHSRQTNICMRSHYDFTVPDGQSPLQDSPKKSKWTFWSRLGFKVSV